MQLTAEGGKDEPGSVKQRLLKLLDGFPEAAPALIDSTPEGQITRADIYDRDPVSSWVNGRIVLLGDAAHQTSPFTGQGAGIAMEDAIVPRQPEESDRVRPAQHSASGCAASIPAAEIRGEHRVRHLMKGRTMSSKLPPGPGGTRTLNTVKWQRDPVAVMEDARERYGDVWTLRLLGGTTFVLVSAPELIEGLFTADPAVLHGGEAKMVVGKALLGGHSLLLVDGQEHMSLRTLMQPAFHRDRIERHRELMARICEEELADWPLHEPMPLLPRMQAITLNVIMSAIFGLSEGGPQESLRDRIQTMHRYAGSSRKMLHLFLMNTRGKDPPQSFSRVREGLDAVIFDEIARARHDEGLGERDDVLAMLVQARRDDGSPMTDGVIRDQLMTLLVQGHSSTAVALAWALERLIRHPEVVERLRAELESGSEDYLDAVVKETLRLRPPIPITTRLVNQSYQLGGYEIEPGPTLVANIYMLHHREDLYPEPERFRPERFLEQKEGTYTWLPFGGGARYCIGRNFATTEMNAVLRHSRAAGAPRARRAGRR